MIVITVQSFNGQAVSGQSASFDELGGTIGRADNNQLVLSDPDRTVSRVHAQVVFRNGGFAVIDKGSNAVQVNGRPLGNGREAPIGDGDLLTIGGYVLRVGLAQAAAATDPFDDLFGGLGANRSAPKPAPAERGSVETMLRPAPRAFPPDPPLASAAAIAGAAAPIPDDWDPFAPAPPAAPASPAAELPLSAPARADSLDTLFGLGGANADPLAHSPLAAPLSQPNTSTDADPLRAFGIAAAVSAPPASDHASDLHTPWMASPLREPAAQAPAPPSGAVLSWNEPSREGKVVTLPGARPDASTRPAAVARPAAAKPPGPLTQIIPRAGGAAPPAPAEAAATPAAWSDSASVQALQAAFAEGLGMPPERVRTLDAAQMRLLGQVLREATRGAVDLLVARAALKREMRSEVTMIVAKENNPLKFSPNVEVALQHIAGESLPGFMAPPAAMRDAFDDLRAHQLGVMAGMRSALAGVLLRFDPAQLEAKISERRSALASLLPSVRKAELWALFTQLYAQLSAEAAEDFHELFGRAFRQAYEAHIEALQREAE